MALAPKAGVNTRRSVLIADVPEAHNLIAQCLPAYELHYAETLEAAKLELIQRPFHLVIVGLHFDESRLFLLLDYLRRHARYGDIPVVCAQAIPSMLPWELRGAVEAALRLVGATAFVQIGGKHRSDVCKLLGDFADGRMPTGKPGAAQSSRQQE